MDIDDYINSLVKDNENLKNTVESLKKEIAVLNTQIENMKYEIGEQRKLTKEIANASAKSQINQSFGKEK